MAVACAGVATRFGCCAVSTGGALRFGFYARRREMNAPMRKKRVKLFMKNSKEDVVGLARRAGRSADSALESF